MKKSIILSFFAILTAVGITSCLDTDNDRYIETDRDLTPQDSVYHLLGILNNMKEIGARYVLLGELRGDLMTATNYAPIEVQELHTMNISNTNSYTTQKEYYKIINQCNYIIERGQALPNERTAVIAIRAWVYLQLVLNYGHAKYYEEFIHTEAQANADYPEVGLDELLEIMIPQLEAIRDNRLPDGYGSVGGSSLITQMIWPGMILGDYYMWAGYNNPAYYEKAAENFLNMIMGERENSDSHLSSTYYFESSSGLPATVINDRMYAKYVSALGRGWTNSWDRLSTNEIYSTIDYPNPDSTLARSNIDTLCGYPYFREQDIAIKQSKVASSLYHSTNYAYIEVERESEYRTNSFGRYVQPLDADYSRMGDLRGDIAMVNPSNPGFVTYQTYFSSVYLPSGTLSEDTVSAKYITSKTVSFYRLAGLYLRYAEALNMMGKPNLAMLILKYGLNPENIAMYMPLNEKPLEITTDDDGEEYAAFDYVRAWNTNTSAALTSVYSFGKFPLSIINKYRGQVPMSLQSLEGGSFTWTVNEASDTTFYFFTSLTEDYYEITKNLDIFAYNAGLHSRGAGCSAADITYQMPYELYPMPVYTKTDDEVLKKQQEYVFQMIANEYALDTAFEGGRFHDLMRISRHQRSPEFLARYVSKKEGAKSYEVLSTPSSRGWDSDSWYLPVNAKER